jgi:hypothetical protein
MHLSFEVAPTNLASFLRHWSSKYNYSAEHKYTNNIGRPLTTKSLRELFEWKNGTGVVIANRKAQSIAANYPLSFTGDKRGRYLNHKQPGGAIWNIFFLHCLEPQTWPIFDQHTFRAMHYMKTGRITEIGSTQRQIYAEYESKYLPFVASLGTADQRTVDRALFAFGQFLKLAARYA